MPTEKIALGVFLAVVGALFALFASAYFMRQEFVDWQAMPLPRIVWLNTGMLVLASIALQCALAAVRQGDTDTMRLSLVTGSVASLGFLAGQLVAWGELTRRRLPADRGPGRELLLPADRAARPAPPRRAGRARPHPAGRLGPRPAGEAAAAHRALHLLLALPAAGLARAAPALHRAGERVHRHLPPTPELRRPPWPTSPTQPPRPAPPRRRARHRLRLVVRPARLQGRVLEEGDDVDLPARATPSSSAASCSPT